MSREARLARIALTPGEPAGVGPDLCVMLAQRKHPAQIVVIADPRVLSERAAQLGMRLELVAFDPKAPRQPQLPGTLLLIAQDATLPVRAGQLAPANAAYVLHTLEIACDACLSGEMDALVTGPVHKGLINQAGFAFSGHTEFLAARCNSTPVMMLMAPGLRVALATTHVPLQAVSHHLSPAVLERVIRTLHRDLEARFHIERPRILICGLNPHAGEGGHLGREEIEVIEPLVRRLQAEGLHLRGPVAADTAFTPHSLRQADVVLTMYHDQGLPVLKHLGFGQAVNVTLGLPIVRTSVDHGTALDLAGSGQADVGSLEAALAAAIELGNPRSLR